MRYKIDIDFRWNYKRKIKTKKLLTRRGMHIDQQCALCMGKDEDCCHLFFDCRFSNQVWKTVLANYGIQRQPLKWSNEKNWLRAAGRGRSRQATIIRISFATTVYYLWQERNLRVMQNQIRSIENISSIIMYYCNLLC